MGATRLFGKPLKEVLGKPLLAYEIERLLQAKLPTKLVVATTTHPQDLPIANLAKELGIKAFRGSEDNVLERYYLAAKENKADVIVRVTGDCPLIDPEIVDQVIEDFLKNRENCDYDSNTQILTFPRGLDVEVFSFQALEKAYLEASSQGELEHVTPYIYTHDKLFKLRNIASPINLASHRWTVDTQEDFQLVEKIIQSLYPANKKFRMNDVLQLLSKNPEWVNINAHIPQKHWSKSS